MLLDLPIVQFSDTKSDTYKYYMPNFNLYLIGEIKKCNNLALKNMVYSFELTYAAFLFPAIPLMMISFNNRYTSLSRLIRKIHDEFINKKISKTDKSAMRYLAQINILNKRLVYVKLMQLFSGLSFFFNLLPF